MTLCLIRGRKSPVLPLPKCPPPNTKQIHQHKTIPHTINLHEVCNQLIIIGKIVAASRWRGVSLMTQSVHQALLQCYGELLFWTLQNGVRSKSIFSHPRTSAPKRNRNHQHRKLNIRKEALHRTLRNGARSKLSFPITLTPAPMRNENSEYTQLTFILLICRAESCSGLRLPTCRSISNNRRGAVGRSDTLLLEGPGASNSSDVELLVKDQKE